MAALQVNEKWQADMAPFFTGLEGKAADKGFLKLESVFYLQ
jgi:L-rhamnose mutarotase